MQIVVGHGNSKMNCTNSAPDSSGRRVDIKQRMAKRFEVDQRAALFSTFGPQRNGDGRDGRQMAAKTTAVLEAENDDHVMDLEAKVNDLKDISLKMREEVLESNKNLGGMSSQFDDVSGMLGGTLRRLVALGSRGNYKHIWILMLFVTGLLFVMYMMYSRRK